MKSTILPASRQTGDRGFSLTKTKREPPEGGSLFVLLRIVDEIRTLDWDKIGDDLQFIWPSYAKFRDKPTPVF